MSEKSIEVVVIVDGVEMFRIQPSKGHRQLALKMVASSMGLRMLQRVPYGTVMEIEHREAFQGAMDNLGHITAGLSASEGRDEPHR